MTDDEHDLDDDDEPLVPPSAERVARRALALTAVVARSIVERQASDAEAESFRAGLLAWTARIGITDEIEPEELAVLQAPVGGLLPQQTINASWRAEGLAVLAWALGRYELPRYDVEADGSEAAAALGFLRELSETVLAAPSLRAPEELAALREALFSLHWRLRNYGLDGLRMDFADFARRAWFGPLSLDGLRLMEGDLEVRGVPLFRAAEKDWHAARSIARERQKAANWLEGQEALYSEVTCDT